MARGGQSGEPIDWVTRAADDAVRHAGEGNLVTVASGASPSGPIHLGNLREFLTPHFVAEELRRRGVAVRHLHSWDDYDRFRKVPAGVPAEWADHIGRPLSAVPDPWECHTSWAEHFKEPLRASLAELGVRMDEIDQTQMYQVGTYREQILHAIKHRDRIDEVLGRYRTKAAPAAETEEEEASLADSVANEDFEGTGDLSRFPYKPWCASCGRDTTDVTAYDDESTDLDYTCRVCGFVGTTNVATEDGGKLVWKVDWPMRWAWEKVNFEPAGLDHMTPGSSYTVGQELVSSIFDWQAPARVTYAFVGIAGMQKMSSSSGGVPTPADALAILEAPMVRWLYTRRAPKQAFTIDFGPEVVRLYDEWDALGRKAADPAKRDVAVLAFERASATVEDGPLAVPLVAVPFRTLSSIADVTAGSADLISQVVEHVGFPHDTVADLEPRLGRAMAWTASLPESDRTTVRATPDTARLAALTEDEELWLRIFLDRLPDSPDLELDAATSVVYGVPKVARGLGFDDAPTDQVKADQKDFFKLLYNLLVDADRGPRLPTLIVALGAETVRQLLGGPSSG
ncbi:MULTISPECIES: lysine--tRNA ligase [Nocardioides]|uniref:lysine--tRNA ligase n=1 Tax=Nocardioides TaxID=1839 RepID=UPI00032FD775|nr:MULTISPECIES: lysine--tRNA ligase [Nocardioides]EON22665.1 lysyl-tRNA synthetase [Nocardioides sp. CF8]